MLGCAGPVPGCLVLPWAVMELLRTVPGLSRRVLTCLGTFVALGSLWKYLQSRKPYKTLFSLMCLASRLSLSWTALGLSCPRTLTSQMIEIFGTDPKKACQSHPPDTNRERGFVKTRHPSQDHKVSRSRPLGARLGQGWPLLA